jgi:hypothetical protein
MFAFAVGKRRQCAVNGLFKKAMNVANVHTFKTVDFPESPDPRSRTLRGERFSAHSTLPCQTTHLDLRRHLNLGLSIMATIWTRKGEKWEISTLIDVKLHTSLRCCSACLCICFLMISSVTAGDGEEKQAPIYDLVGDGWNWGYNATYCARISRASL